MSVLDEPIHICGRVESVLYQNEDNGYSVCDIEDENDKLFTATGNMPFISVGEKVELFGKWTQHKQYGTQFSVERCEKILPTSKNDILRYLSSGAIKGIGPKIAQKIVEKYGEDSFDVISNHPNWLAEIKGISLTKANEMSKDFKEKAGVREIVMYCNGRFSPNTAMKIYKTLGSGAVGLIESNPYILCENVPGVPFKLSDDMALDLGLGTENENRIKSAIRYVLRVFASRDGHTYSTREVLLDATSKLIEVHEDKIDPYIDQLAFEDKLKIVCFRSEQHIYLTENYLSEEYISKKLLLLKNTVISVDYRNTKSFIEQIEARNGIQYAKMQKKAIEATLMNGVTIITGGPGTGKTTIVKAVIQIFSQLGLRCGLCAPTGRASQRMSEATSHEATTVHKLLDATSGGEFEFGPVFDRNEKNLLDKEIVIVDESSMMDVHLTEALLRAMKPGSRLILIGDTHQLPSVGEGNVLGDVISSECFPVVELDEIFRQSEESGIVMNAYEINNGRIPDLSKKYNDFFFISINDEEAIPEYIANLCTTRLPKSYGVDPLLDIQVITPTKMGTNGTRLLNIALQAKLNPQNVKKAEKGADITRILREGDKIMQTRNNYANEWTKGIEKGIGIYNGDVGIIKSIKAGEDKTITVDFDGRVTDFGFSQADELEHAYAITVHKSQGSEYPIVIIPMTKSAPMLLTRNLIYTAITRASRVVILLGKKEVFEYMVQNDKQIIRNTGLCQLLRSNSDEY
ncbi:MAG: ATP-dependent RecD-like DNA helicase [Clostridia bacterium]|nr:ATP-dependent RecD-like DNA helicase [Clostridia bacterium]